MTNLAARLCGEAQGGEILVSFTTTFAVAVAVQPFEFVTVTV